MSDPFRSQGPVLEELARRLEEEAGELERVRAGLERDVHRRPPRATDSEQLHGLGVLTGLLVAGCLLGYVMACLSVLPRHVATKRTRANDAAAIAAARAPLDLCQRDLSRIRAERENCEHESR